MKVIANGNTNQVECEKCHAKLEFDKYDLRWTHTEEDYYYVECPICHEMIWLKSTKELDQMYHEAWVEKHPEENE